MKKRYKVGCIGFGARGKGLCAAVVNNLAERAEIVAAADLRNDVMIPDSFSKGFRLYQDYRELLADNRIDTIFIATWETLHLEIIEAALDAGKAVYCEKPVVPTLKQAERLYHRLKKGNALFKLGLNLSYYPAAIKMRELIQKKILGKITCVQAFTNAGSKFGEDCLPFFFNPDNPRADFVLAKLTHSTDLLHHVLGTYAETVCGQVANQHWGQNSIKWKPQSNDTAVISGRYNNSILFSIVYTTVGPIYERVYHFNGVDGEMHVVFRSKGDNIRVHLNNQEPCSINITPDKGGHGGADVNILRAFFDYLDTGGNTPEEPERVLTSIMVPLAALQSSKESKSIQTGRWYRNVVSEFKNVSRQKY